PHPAAPPGALRERLESYADRLDAAPCEHLGADGPARLTGLGGALAVKAVTAGAFPGDLMRRA
ncbi:hypothetical protein SIN09_32465, partial [Streptomyces sp. F8]|nr:hypothetical protein [Streptomyces sp. F8]